MEAHQAARGRFQRHRHAADKVPCTILRYRVDGWLVSKLAERKLGFTIAPPLDPMHRVGGKQVNYASVPKKEGPKLDDCRCWISYLYKVRSKAGVMGQAYTSSTNRGAIKGRQLTPPAAHQRQP